MLTALANEHANNKAQIQNCTKIDASLANQNICVYNRVSMYTQAKYITTIW